MAIRDKRVYVMGKPQLPVPQSTCAYLDLEGKPDEGYVYLGGITYVFSVAMREKETTATFKLKDGSNAAAEVIGENRAIAVKDGQFEDKFKGYEVHLYKIKP